MKQYLFIFKFVLIASFILNIIIPFTNALDSSELFTICHKSDPNYQECIKSNALSLRPSLASGIQSLDIPSLEPMAIPEFSTIKGSGDVSLDSKFTNQKVYGFTGYNITNLSVSPDLLNYRLNIRHQSLSIKGNYKINGTINNLPIFGSGTNQLDFTSINSTVLLAGVKKKVDSEQRFSLNAIKFTITNIKNVKIIMKNLFNGDEKKGDDMNDYLNEQRKTIIKVWLASISQSISAALKDAVSKLFDSFPYQTLFPE
ncbi:protein takeout-like [Lycorma delicatula]|uniref:protein takeout-like n=1 Tax=Lycorma delicatula TaxID=130591 RepID=UPI003F514D00